MSWLLPVALQGAAAMNTNNARAREAEGDGGPAARRQRGAGGGGGRRGGGGGAGRQQQRRQPPREEDWDLPSDEEHHGGELSNRNLAIALLQLEARLRDVENISMITLTAREDLPLHCGSTRGAITFDAAVRAGTADLPPPHLQCAGSGLKEQILAGISDTADEGVHMRYEIALDLLCLMVRLTPPEANALVRTFRTAPLYRRENQPPRARIVYAIKGLASLKAGAKARNLATLAAARLPGFSWNDRELQTMVWDNTTALPSDPVARQIDIEAAVTAWLCSAGATRTASRAPRGGAFWRMHHAVGRRR